MWKLMKISKTYLDFFDYCLLFELAPEKKGFLVNWQIATDSNKDIVGFGNKDIC